MSHILRLPTELLQSISAYGVDLAILRLVCKTFNTAFVDEFGKLYFTELVCFLLDRGRLSRLNNVLLSPHLARHVKKVYLLLDPLEGKPSCETPMTLLPHFEDQFDIGRVYARMSMLESKFEPYIQRDPPMDAISEVIQNLCLSGCPYVALECELPTLGLSSNLLATIEANADEIALDVLQALYRARCTLSELRLSHSRFLDRFVEGSGSRVGLLEYCRSITTLSYEADLSDLQRVFGNSAPNDHPELCSEWAMIPVLQGASSLQTLNLYAPLFPQGSRSKTTMDFAAAVLRPYGCTNLRSITLTSMPCDVESMWDALRSWKNTLHHLRLSLVSLETPGELPLGEGWSKAFDILLTCPQLSRLFLYMLCERNSTGNAGPWLGLKESEDSTIAEKLDVQGSPAIQKALRLAVQGGCTWRS